MTTYLVYYLETNMICIIMLLASFGVLYNKSIKPSADEIIFRRLVIECILYCSMDIVAAIFKKVDFAGVRVILYIANSLYIAIPALLTLDWCKYIMIRLRPCGFKEIKAEKGMFIVLVLNILATLSTPLTNFAFTLNSYNIYQRTIGAYFVPIICLFVLLHFTAKAMLLSIRTKDLADKEKAQSIVYFVFPTIICSGIQILVYGITVTQVGLTLGIVGTLVINQKAQISKDELTRLNNRREFDKYIGTVDEKTNNSLVCMVDVNNFKNINDRYGHLEGDTALKRIATVLSTACRKSGENCFLCRYGGDEFVIVCKEPSRHAEVILRESIISELIADNEKDDNVIQIHISLGFAEGVANTKYEYEYLLENADKRMYISKRRGIRDTLGNIPKEEE